MNTTGETYTPSGTGSVYVLTQPVVTFPSLTEILHQSQ